MRVKKVQAPEGAQEVQEVQEQNYENMSLAELYEAFEDETVRRRKGAGVPADQVRQFVHEVMDATGKDEVVLAAVVRAITKSIGKVENGSVRSAVQKEFDLVKKDSVVYIVKKS